MLLAPHDGLLIPLKLHILQGCAEECRVFPAQESAGNGLRRRGRVQSGGRWLKTDWAKPLNRVRFIIMAQTAMKATTAAARLNQAIRRLSDGTLWVN